MHLAHEDLLCITSLFVSKCVEDCLCQMVSYTHTAFFSAFYVPGNPGVYTPRAQNTKLETITVASSVAMLEEAQLVTSHFDRTRQDKLCRVDPSGTWDLSLIMLLSKFECLAVFCAVCANLSPVLPSIVISVKGSQFSGMFAKIGFGFSVVAVTT